MQFPYNILTTSNPIVRGLYQQVNDQGQDFPPPGHNFWVETISGDQMVTTTGDKYIFLVE